MKKKISMPVGLSALLTIFAVLCLTVFSLLSLATARADGRLAEKSRQAAIDYYNAECCAESLVAKLRAGQIPEGIQRENDIYSFACKISDTQLLRVSVAISGQDYEIITWQAVSTADWQPNEKIHVWKGETP